MCLGGEIIRMVVAAHARRLCRLSALNWECIIYICGRVLITSMFFYSTILHEDASYFQLLTSYISVENHDVALSIDHTLLLGCCRIPRVELNWFSSTTRYPGRQSAISNLLLILSNEIILIHTFSLVSLSERVKLSFVNLPE